MNEIRVTISGPGMVINGPLHVIKSALESCGYRVEISNGYAWELTDAQAEDFVKSIKYKGTVKILMDHQPWGG